MQHGWYSEKMAKRSGTVVWADPEGNEVTVTEVSSSDACPNKWDDTVYVGPVVAYVRGRLKRSPFESELPSWMPWRSME